MELLGANKIALSLVCVLSVLLGILGYLYNNALKEIAELEAQNQIHLQNTQELQGAIQKQNTLLKELEVKETLVDNSKLLEIFIKDESCEAELGAYKKLFKELGR